MVAIAYFGVAEVAVDRVKDDGAVAQGDADALKAQGDARADAGEGLEGQAAALPRHAQQRRHQPPQLLFRALLLHQPLLLQPAQRKDPPAEYYLAQLHTSASRHTWFAVILKATLISYVEAEQPDR